MDKNFFESSFKGARFWVTEMDTTGGRSTSIYEYPFGDRVDAADLGLKAKKFKLSGFVIDSAGKGYDEYRNDLINVLDSPGSGELVHHRYGKLVVYSLGYTAKESTKTLNRADFELEFIIENKQTLLSQFTTSAAVIQTTDGLNTKADKYYSEKGTSDNAKNPAAKEIAKTEVTAGLSTFTGIKNKLIGGVGFVRAAIDSINGVADTYTQVIADVSNELTTIQSGLATLINTPNMLMTRLAGLYNSLTGIIDTLSGAEKKIAQSELMAAFGVMQTGNENSAVGAAIKSRALTTRSKLGAAIQYEDDVEIKRLLEPLIADIKARADNAPPELIAPLRALRVALENHRIAVLINVPQKKTITHAQPMPLLLTAFENNMTFEQIIALNTAPDSVAATGSVYVYK